MGPQVVWEFLNSWRRVEIWLMQPRAGRNPTCCLRIRLSQTGVKRQGIIETKTSVTIGVRPIPRWLLQLLRVTSGYCQWLTFVAPNISEHGDKCIYQCLSTSFEKQCFSSWMFRITSNSVDVQSDTSQWFIVVGVAVTALVGSQLLEVFSSTVEPLLSIKNRLSISNSNSFKNRSSPLTIVTHLSTWLLTVIWSRYYDHFLGHIFNFPLKAYSHLTS